MPRAATARAVLEAAISAANLQQGECLIQSATFISLRSLLVLQAILPAATDS